MTSRPDARHARDTRDLTRLLLTGVSLVLLFLLLAISAARMEPAHAGAPQRIDGEEVATGARIAHNEHKDPDGCMPEGASGGASSEASGAHSDGLAGSIRESVREALRDMLPELSLPAIPGVPAGATPEPPHAASPNGSTLQDATATFRLCAGSAAQHEAVARALEALIAGRSFSTSLVSGAQGCADLTVRARGTATSGTVTSRLSVSVPSSGSSNGGSGASERLTVQITSEGGATRVAIGPDA